MLKTSDESTNEGLIEKAELIMAIKEYDDKKRRRWKRGIDIIVSPVKSDDRILMRVINKSRSKSGVVGVDAVREMSEVLESNGYDSGFLVGKRFSRAARDEMSRQGIRLISENLVPYYKPERLYTTINDCIEDLCQAKCGHVPEKESDCKGYSEGHYSCKIRLISDNASFHFERGWGILLQNDLKRLLAIGNSLGIRNKNSARKR